MSTKRVERLSNEKANEIALGQIRQTEGKELRQNEWKFLFKKFMGRYLKKHPKRESLDPEDWEGNYKRMVIYERKIMDAVTLVLPALKRKNNLDEFRRQYGISDANINWNHVIQLNEDAIFEFRDYLNWSEVSKRPFSEDFIKHVAEFIDWKVLAKGYVSEETIRKYHKRLDWKALSQRGLPQTILREFEDKVHWKELPSLHYTEDFMIEFYDRLRGVEYAPENVKFFKKVGWKKINWDTIKVDNLSEEFIMKKAEKINWNLNRVELSTRCWPRDFIEDFEDYFIWKTLPVAHIKNAKFIYKYRDRIDWASLSYELRSEKFIDVFHQYVVWEHLPAKEFSDGFVIKHRSKIYWPNLLVDHLSEETLDQCNKFLIWSRVSRKENLSEEFIEKYKAKVDWDVIAHRKDLSKKFKRRYAKFIQPHLRDVYQAATQTEHDYTENLMDPRNQKFMGNYR